MEKTEQLKLLKLSVVEERYQISRSGIYARLNPKSPGFDPEFPAPIRVGLSSVRFIEHELEAYFASRPRAASKSVSA